MAMAISQDNPFTQYQAQDDQIVVYTAGLGDRSCATALRDEAQAQVWSWGFWTGMNFAKGSVTGSATDPMGIWEEIKLVCEAEPSLKLLSAAAKVHIDMTAKGR